jgi:hypothetical protein
LLVLPLSLFHLENRVCLSCDVQVVGAAWRAAMRIMVGVGDLVQKIRDGRTGRILSGRAIESSGGAVYDLHCAHGDRSVGFLIEPQNQGLRFVSGLTSKPQRRVSLIWPQNR